jgi:putative hydrolase of HD superfamily
MINLHNLHILWWLLDQFRKTERDVYAVWLDRKENDSEHTFELAMICRYLCLEYNKNWWDLDVNKVIKYALVHDLVEIYAWDTNTYNTSQELIDSKHEREMSSLDQLRNQLPFFSELLTEIDIYEDQTNEEAIFVKWIDKSVYPLNQIRDNYRSWKTLSHWVSLGHIDAIKQKKIKHPFAKKLRDTIHTFLIDMGWFSWNK